MNIVMFVDRFYPFIGGVEKHVMMLSQKLINKGNKVTIITRGNSNIAYKENYKGISIIRINFDRKFTILNIYYEILKNIKIILKSDIIHFHDYSTFYYWYYPFRYIFSWKKHYITFHGWEGEFPPRKKVVEIRRKCEKLTNGNICVGNFIEKWYGTNANKIIYGASEKKDNIENIKEKNKIVYLGRLEKDTGVLKYIEILKIIKLNYNVDIKFEICGDGKLKKDIIRELESYNIEYIDNGFIEDSNKYLATSKICFTSGYLSIIEAMNNDNIIVALYDNELKKDYLTMMPCSNEMIIGEDNLYLAKEILKILNNEDEYLKRVSLAKEWSVLQTWSNIMNVYLDLWNYSCNGKN